MKDINLVLRNKRVQLAELALEINGLEAAATALRPIAHLLSEEDVSPEQPRVTWGRPPSAVQAEHRSAALPLRFVSVTLAKRRSPQQPSLEIQGFFSLAEPAQAAQRGNKKGKRAPHQKEVCTLAARAVRRKMAVATNRDCN